MELTRSVSAENAFPRTSVLCRVDCVLSIQIACGEVAPIPGHGIEANGGDLRVLLANKLVPCPNRYNVKRYTSDDRLCGAVVGPLQHRVRLSQLALVEEVIRRRPIRRRRAGEHGRRELQRLRADRRGEQHE